MPRQKKYNEEEVAEKAMKLFWANGYATTSARMLEKAMGINLFSIYSSFQNKEGVLLASVRCYKRKVRAALLTPLEEGPQNVGSIKKFFFDFLHFVKEKKSYKGCLLINTANELGSEMASLVAKEIMLFSQNIIEIFRKIIATNKRKSAASIEKETSYLFLALQGTMLTAKTNDIKAIENYIEMTFKGI